MPDFVYLNNIGFASEIFESKLSRFLSAFVIFVIYVSHKI